MGIKCLLTAIALTLVAGLAVASPQPAAQRANRMRGGAYSLPDHTVMVPKRFMGRPAAQAPVRKVFEPAPVPDAEVLAMGTPPVTRMPVAPPPLSSLVGHSVELDGSRRTRDGRDVTIRELIHEGAFTRLADLVSLPRAGSAPASSPPAVTPPLRRGVTAAAPSTAELRTPAEPTVRSFTRREPAAVEAVRTLPEPPAVAAGDVVRMPASATGAGGRVASKGSKVRAFKGASVRTAGRGNAAPIGSALLASGTGVVSTPVMSAGAASMPVVTKSAAKPVKAPAKAVNTAVKRVS